MVTWRYVSPGYFATLRIPIVRGRAFQDEDRAASDQTVILSESLARRLFPSGDAVGGRLLVDGGATVVGIAADVRNGGPLRPADPEYYMLRRRIPTPYFEIKLRPAGGTAS